MKNFILALLLLTLTIGLTAANAYAVQTRIDRLKTLAAEDNFTALCDALSRVEPFFSLTVNHTILEQALQAAEEMRAYGESGESDAQAPYRAAKATLLSLLCEIESGEKFSFSNIF